MSKKLVTYVPLPSKAELEKVENLLHRQKVIRRRRKTSKLLPFIATIKVYLDRGFSPQGICARVLNLHSCDCNRKTMWRFILKNEVLLQSYATARKQTKLKKELL